MTNPLATRLRSRYGPIDCTAILGTSQADAKQLNAGTIVLFNCTGAAHREQITKYMQR
jgi:hypothetical protein